LNKFSVVGIGPGHPDYLLPISLQAIENAELLIGGRRHLDLFSRLNKKELELKGNYDEVFSYIKENCPVQKIAVLVSGDPGYHSLLGRISIIFEQSEYTVFPGLSSFQLAMARIGKTWNDVELISLHGKNLEDTLNSQKGKMVLLTDFKNTPKAIADYLLSRGFQGRNVFIAENLSYSNERIIQLKMEEIKEEEYKLCLMIIE
jgi:cobalt-precorrin-7 (C5)-methyltransferase